MVHSSGFSASITRWLPENAPLLLLISVDTSDDGWRRVHRMPKQKLLCIVHDDAHQNEAAIYHDKQLQMRIERGIDKTKGPNVLPEGEGWNDRYGSNHRLQPTLSLLADGRVYGDALIQEREDGGSRGVRDENTWNGDLHWHVDPKEQPPREGLLHCSSRRADRPHSETASGSSRRLRWRLPFATTINAEEGTDMDHLRNKGTVFNGLVSNSQSDCVVQIHGNGRTGIEGFRNNNRSLDF